jgi:hypothetical protein
MISFEPRSTEMEPSKANLSREMKFAKSLYGDLPKPALYALKEMSQKHQVSVANGDVKYLNGSWYVTHSGLLRLAERLNCAGIHSRPVLESSDPATYRWVFRAAVFKSPTCRGFIGYGDADPSNVSPLVHGAEMRVAETRAVNRALRKAYGIGICSGEEIGTQASQIDSHPDSKKRPQPANGNGSYGGPKVRDRLCQLIRQHQLDPNLVKSYATDFCGVKTLRDATREQVEGFVTHLADWAEKDRNALLCQLNSYPGQKKKVPHEALFRVSPPCRCVGASLRSGRPFPGSGGSGAIPLAQTEAVLRDPLRCPQTQAFDRVFHDWPPVLHPQGYVEAELVSARLRL